MTDLAAGANEHAAVLSNVVSDRSGILTEEQRQQLSKALFPDTYTDEVEVCGKQRKIRPLTIKPARVISSLLESFQTLVNEAQVSKSPIEIDVLKNILSVCSVLAGYYKWEDVKAKIEEEDVSLSELQLLIVQQVRLQDSNDFLLNGLRTLVGVMQVHEITALHLQSISNGQLSLNTTDAPLTN